MQEPVLHGLPNNHLEVKTSTGKVSKLPGGLQTLASDSNVRGGRKSMEVCESTEDVNVSNSFMWTEKIFHVDLKPPPHFLDV